MSGFGKRADPDGSVCEGFFHNGMRHGYSVLHYNKTTKSAYYSADLLHGLSLFNTGNTLEYNLYENNEKIYTFSLEEVEKINKNDTFWYALFKEEDSITKLVGHQTFLEPIEFKIVREEVNFRLECIEPEGPKLNPFLELILGDGASRSNGQIDEGKIPSDFLTTIGNKYFNDLKKSM